MRKFFLRNFKKLNKFFKKNKVKNKKIKAGITLNSRLTKNNTENYFNITSF